MTKRGRRLVAVLASVAVLATCAVVLWPREDRITRANFDRIREGMSRSEVEAILGPAVDCSTGPLKMPAANFPDGWPVGEFVPSSWIDSQGATDSDDIRMELVEWRSDRRLFFVYFSPSGRVVTTGCNDVLRAEQTAFENLVWRLKRQWRRWFPEN